MSVFIRILALAIISLNALTLSSTISESGGAGSWHVYESFAGMPQQVIDTGKMVYYLSGGNLFSYDVAAEETTAYTTGNKLNGKSISRIFYNPEGRYLTVCYDTGAIDLLYDDGKTEYISDIADSGLASPVIFNDIEFSGNNFYVATDFGIVKFEVSRHRAVKSGNYGRNVSGIALMGEKLLMVVDDTLRIARDTDNFSRISQTEPLARVGAARLMSPEENSLLLLTDRIMLMNIYADKAEEIRSVSSGKVTDWFLSGGKPVYYGDGRLCSYSTSEKREEIICRLPEEISGDRIGYSGSKGTLWALSRHGLAGYKVGQDGTLANISQRFRPTGMSVSEVCRLVPSADEKRLYIINHGPTSYRYGFPEGDNGYSIPGAAACLDMATGKIADVTPYPVEAAADITRPLQQNHGPYPFAVTSIAEHPEQSDVFFMGTGNDGLYMVRDGRFVGRYDSSNSPLRPVWGWIVYSLAFDRGGNLWVISNHDNYSDVAMMVLPYEKTLLDPSQVRKSDWVVPDADGYHGDMDSKILVCRHSPMIFIIDKLKPQILLACDTKNTPDNLSDDTFRLYGELVDQDGNSLSNCVVSAITEDIDGSIWIGTFEKGIYCIANPAEAVDSEVTARHIKVPRDDGSGMADYLLADDIINDIAVDGAGRKWIATENSGLFLVNSDGSRIISHYTPDNSPLPSYTVNALYAEPQGRRIFIGTPDGLLHFVSDTAPDSGRLESLHIYPNPVRPDYSGPVKIDGLTDGALVKIADQAGNVIVRGRAEGGTFSWNVSASNVAAGMYHVTATARSGDTRFGKIVIIR